MNGSDLGTGAWALLITLAFVGAATFVVFGVGCLWFSVANRHERRRQRNARPGPLPEEAFRRVREPVRPNGWIDPRELPESGLTTRELEDWPVRDPRPGYLREVGRERRGRGGRL